MMEYAKQEQKKASDSAAKKNNVKNQDISNNGAASYGDVKIHYNSAKPVHNPVVQGLFISKDHIELTTEQIKWNNMRIIIEKITSTLNDQMDAIEQDTWLTSSRRDPKPDEFSVVIQGLVTFVKSSLDMEETLERLTPKGSTVATRTNTAGHTNFTSATVLAGGEILHTSGSSHAHGKHKGSGKPLKRRAEKEDTKDMTFAAKELLRESLSGLLPNLSGPAHEILGAYLRESW